MRFLHAYTLAALCATTAGAMAGPPFVTDDPQPTAYGHFVLTLFAAGTHADGATSGTAAGLQLTYGLQPDLEVNATVPLEFEADPASRAPFRVLSARRSASSRASVRAWHRSPRP